jgi:hypothetical protein
LVGDLDEHNHGLISDRRSDVSTVIYCVIFHAFEKNIEYFVELERGEFHDLHIEEKLLKRLYDITSCVCVLFLLCKVDILFEKLKNFVKMG